MVGYYTDSSKVTHGFLATLNKATATVTLGGLAAIYDGTAKVATATTNPPSLNVTFTYNGSSTAPTAAGSYTVVGTINDPNYQGSATGTFVISQAMATVTLGGLAAIYDGTAKVATATTNPPSLNVTFTYNGSSTAPTAAGSYTVVGTINDPNYYQISSTGTLVILPGFSYTTIDPPGSISTPDYGVGNGVQVTGVSGGNVVGYYSDKSSYVTHGFLYNSGTYTTIDPQGTAYNSAANGVSGNNVVGYYEDSSGVSHGFLYNSGTYTTIDPPGTAGTVAIGISGNNVVGYYSDSSKVTHGFLYSGTYTTIDPPGSTYNQTHITGVSGSNVVGYYEDSSGVWLGFLYNGGTYTTIDPPGTSGSAGYGSQVTGVCGNNVVGYYTDTNSYMHGFLYNGSTYTTIYLPGTIEVAGYGSQATGIDGNNVVGYYTDKYGYTHGYLYNGSTFTTIDPGTPYGTAPSCVSGNNVAGKYNSNGVQLGFVTTFIKATATMTLGNLVTVYNGSPQAATATTNPSGLNVTFTYNGSSTPPTNAGSYTVLGTISDPSYQGSATGTLVISATFGQWESFYGFTGGLTDTPEKDSVPNLLKYVYDINPSGPMNGLDRAALPTVGIDTTTTPGTQYLTLTYRQYAALTDVTINVQTSSDLQNWSTVNPPALFKQVSTDSITGDPIMEVGVKLTGAKQQFIRLNVTQP